MGDLAASADSQTRGPVEGRGDRGEKPVLYGSQESPFMFHACKVKCLGERLKRGNAPMHSGKTIKLYYTPYIYGVL